MIIIVDDEDRENEGDLAIATEKVTAESLAFMLNYGRGLICTSISLETARLLDLPLQVLHNNSPFNTPFAVSVDLAHVASCGVTASARAKTMQAMLLSNSKPEDFVSPGHVFPLIAHPEGVIGRQGQTEAAYDLARLAGLAASGVICEIMNQDGLMASGQSLNDFAERHQLKITSVADIIQYRIAKEILLEHTASRRLETDWGEFEVRVFRDDVEGKEHLALCHGNYQEIESPLLRIHSECLTGDVFGSRRCDCGLQLDQAMQRIVSEGAGVVLYLRQEGRGIGLLNKLRAYALQDQGLDTVDANLKLGFAADQRDFAVAAKMLGFLELPRVRLLTNNPQKVETLNRFGVCVEKREGITTPEDEFARPYISCKRERMGHFL